MTDVSVLGLGLMGSALAGALLRSGSEITVWNRSPQKMATFIDLGATAADSVCAAIESSQIILICVSDYDSSRKLLFDQQIETALSGRAIVQISTGSPDEAREFEAWATGIGARYLDCAIMVYPDQVGATDAVILASGSKEAFEQCESVLASLAGDVRYLGTGIGAAATVDLAILSQDLGNILGFVHGALMCESEGVEVDLYADLLSHSLPSPETILHQGKVIKLDEYDNPQANLGAYYGCVESIQRHAHTAGINSELPDLLSSIFKRAVSAGLVEEEYVAFIKVLRKDSGDH
jgi:3-hydroxyisobutyrate dehydrogenase-like beta-hydroxyacid dehydrogenase